MPSFIRVLREFKKGNLGHGYLKSWKENNKSDPVESARDARSLIWCAAISFCFIVGSVAAGLLHSSGFHWMIISLLALSISTFVFTLLMAKIHNNVAKRFLSDLESDRKTEEWLSQMRDRVRSGKN